MMVYYSDHHDNDERRWSRSIAPIIHSFMSRICAAPLQEIYSEALPVQPPHYKLVLIKQRSLLALFMDNSRIRYCIPRGQNGVCATLSIVVEVVERETRSCPV